MATGTDIYVIELVDRVSGRARSAHVNVTRLGGGLEKLGRSSRLAQFGLDAAANAVGNLAARGISAGISAVMRLGGAIADTAMLASKSTFQLNAFFGSAEAGAKAQKSAIDLSRRYGLELEGVLDSMAKFKGAGFSLEQSENFVKLAADLKLSGEEVKRFARALGQMKGGPLKAEEINQLTDLNPNAFSKNKVFDVLAKRMGKSVAEIRKLQEAGEISGDLGINAVAESALRSINQTDFGALGERAANETIDGLTGRIKSNIEADLFESVKRAEPALAKGLNAILGGVLGVDGKGFQDALTNALVKVGQELEKLGPRIPGFVASLEKVAAVLSEISKVLGPISSVLGFAGTVQTDVVGGTIGKAIFAVSDTFEDINAKFRSWTDKSLAPTDGLGRAPTEALAASPLDDLAFSAAREGLDGTLDAADRAALAAPSAGIRSQVVEAAAAVSAGTGGKRVDVGAMNFTVNLSGSGDPTQAGESIRNWVETDLAATLERQLEGTGD